MEVVDTRGLLCPMPVVKTQQRVKDLPVGTEIHVRATDPGVLEDIPAWCRIHGHQITCVQKHDHSYDVYFVISS